MRVRGAQTREEREGEGGGTAASVDSVKNQQNQTAVVIAEPDQPAADAGRPTSAPHFAFCCSLRVLTTRYQLPGQVFHRRLTYPSPPGHPLTAPIHTYVAPSAKVAFDAQVSPPPV